MTIQKRLRHEAETLRTKSMPLKHLIPLLQQAADALDAAQQERKPEPEFPVNWATMLHYPECWDTAAYPELRDAIHEALAWSGCTVCNDKAQQERKPHTEAEVQRIIFCAYETFGRKGFEDVVRETLGVPAPKETP